MVTQNWVWQKLSDVFKCPTMKEEEGFSLHREQKIPPNQNYPSGEQITKARIKAQGEWFAAIAALENLLLSLLETAQPHSTTCQGLLLSGPLPILSHSALVSRFQTGIFTAEAFQQLALMPFQLPVASPSAPETLSSAITELPLLLTDPIATEQFCLVLTPYFGLLMVFGENAAGLPNFQFSFVPEVIQQAWLLLRSRLLLTKHHQLSSLEALVTKFSPPHPDYRLVMEFSRQLLQHLPEIPVIEAQKVAPFPHQRKRPQTEGKCEKLSPDIELLQALTHEIRTPLTTIRTMTRILLKRTSNLIPEITKYLEIIDQECSEQINRMELIFRATELETASTQKKQVHLVPIALEQVFQQSIPRWKKQAQRRNVELDVVLPQKLPQVVSDPAMLEQMLTGLMEKFTRSVSTGGQIRVQVSTAGHQLKLQFYSESIYQSNPLKALGQLLMFQPETGNLSLNLDVTKNLFHALGGKLIVRNRPQKGEVMTIFLPLGRGKL